MKFQIPSIKIQTILTGIFVICYLLFGILPARVLAASNIDDTDRWAWSEVVGWIDFQTDGTTKNINVFADHLEGIANSAAIGKIALNCATTPSGNICAGAGGDWKIINSGGVFSGWAWSEAIGWISFNYLTGGGAIPYAVTLDSSTGELSGWAWNDIAGWISFNCLNTSSCASPGISYRVKALFPLVGVPGGMLTSSVFDTTLADGVTLNTIRWRGSLPTGTAVKFQIASSNSATGPWNFVGYDGAITTYYPSSGQALPDASVLISGHTNKRYFRYRVFLNSDTAQTVSPRVDDVIINYSP